MLNITQIRVYVISVYWLGFGIYSVLAALYLLLVWLLVEQHSVPGFFSIGEFLLVIMPFYACVALVSIVMFLRRRWWARYALIAMSLVNMLWYGANYFLYLETMIRKKDSITVFNQTMFLDPMPFRLFVEEINPALVNNSMFIALLVLTVVVMIMLVQDSAKCHVRRKIK